ncbi:MAG: hypothetical protein ACOC6O_02055 [Chloroflexota bacterium]
MPHKHDKTSKLVNFWNNKSACWEMTHCPEEVRNDCPAYSYREYPCWEIEGTYCKWAEWGALGQDIDRCSMCIVYLAYGEGKPICLSLTGKGIKLLLKH